jgi:hypothetical protein
VLSGPPASSLPWLKYLLLNSLRSQLWEFWEVDSCSAPQSQLTTGEEVYVANLGFCYFELGSWSLRRLLGNL